MKKIIVILFIGLLLTGCAGQSQEPTAATAAVGQQRLLLSVVPEQGSSASFELPCAMENTYGEISFLDMKEVNLQLPSGEKPLEEALNSGEISLGEISAYAQLDAQNGVCQVSYSSENGLAQYVYTYPEYQLYLVNDLYERPNGTTVAMQQLCVAAPSQGEREIDGFDVDEGGNSLDREDWGLTWTVLEATASGVKLQCSQQGGQQLGQLAVSGYWLESENAERPKPIAQEIPLTMGGSAEVTLDWTEQLGALAPGAYRLHLTVDDLYAPAAVHPLMRNYCDVQGYELQFTVEEGQP